MTAAKCSCTFEAGDSECAAHPTCPECGGSLDGFWGRIAARLSLENAANRKRVEALEAGLREALGLVTGAIDIGHGAYDSIEMKLADGIDKQCEQLRALLPAKEGK